MRRLAATRLAALVRGILDTRAGRLLGRAFPGGAVLLSALTFAGYAMGLVRDRLFAHTFGAGADLDAYNAAFVLPELALDVLVAGGLVAPFVPLFLGLKDEAAHAAFAFARTVLTLAVGVMGTVSAVLFVLAPLTIPIIAPGFNASQQELYVGLFRVMCLTPVIFSASIVVGEVLVAENRFLAYGLAPLMYNGGIVASTWFLSDRLGIYAAALGAVAGALGHLGIRLVGLWRSRFRPRPSFRLRTRGLGEFIRLMLPRMVSQPIEPLTFLFYTSLASTLAAGSVSSISFARNFQSVPVSLVGMSFAIAAFPALSAAVVDGDRRGYRRILGTNLLSIGLLTTAAALLLFVLSGLVIRLFLGGGRFDQEDADRTTVALAAFTLSIPLESLTHMLARGVYATRNTILPTLASVAGFIVIVITAHGLVGDFGIVAIPLSFALGMAAKVAVLVLAVIVRLPLIGAPRGTRTSRTPRAIARHPAFARAAAAVMAVAIGAVTLAIAGDAMQGASIAAAPVVTPWVQEAPRASLAVPTLPPNATLLPMPSGEDDEDPSAAASAGASAGPGASASPGASPAPFDMDLYAAGDFVGEFRDTWCVPAAMQTSINIMTEGADTTKATQTRLYNLAYSIAPGKTGGADAEGWSGGLTQLGYGPYVVDSRGSIRAAAITIARAIRLTNRPAGMLVWYGWHSWVVSGFRATADPATNRTFEVTGLYVEDVWYDRVSSIWGPSNPPDTFVPIGDLSIDYKPFHQGIAYPGKDGRFVMILPQP